MGWTELDLQKWKDKRYSYAESDLIKILEADPDPDEGPESILQGKIEDYCESHGYPYLSIRQAVTKYPRIAHIFKDWTDVTIAAPGGRTILIELKAKKGALSKGQRLKAMQLLALGHEWHQLKTWAKFIEIMEGDNREDDH